MAGRREGDGLQFVGGANVAKAAALREKAQGKRVASRQDRRDEEPGRDPSAPAKRTGRPGKGNRGAECAHKSRCAARRVTIRRERKHRAALLGMTMSVKPGAERDSGWGGNGVWWRLLWP